MQLYADAEPDAYSTTDSYPNANTEPNADSDTNCDPDAYPNANSYTNTDGYTNADSDGYPNANANSCAGSGHDLSQRLTQRRRDGNRRGHLLPRVKCYSKGNAGQQLFHVRGLV